MKRLPFVFGLLVMTAHVSSLFATTPGQNNRSTGQFSEMAPPKPVAVRDVALLHTAQILPDSEAINFEGCGGTEGRVLNVIKQLDDVLREGGSSLEQVVKLNVYVSQDTSVGVVQSKLVHRFARSRMPAVSYVCSYLPVGRANIAMDAVAVTTQSPKQVQRWIRSEKSGGKAHFLNVGKTAGAILPVGPRVYISGQVEMEDGTLKAATRQTMAGLMKTLEHLGLSGRDVVQLKAFANPAYQAQTAIDEMMAAFPNETPPPIVMVEWESSLPIEIELIAASPLPPAKEAPSLEFLTPPWMEASPVFARVVRVNHPETIYLSGLFGQTEAPSSDGEVREIFNEVRRQTEAAGGDMRHLVKATYYVSDNEVSGHLNTVRPEFYDPQRPPSASKAKVRGTGREGRTITLDMIAVPKTP